MIGRFSIRTISGTSLLLIAVLLFAFISRITRLSYPTEYYFDEVYHAATAKLIAHNDARAYEWWNSAPEPNTAVDWLHPPFAKLTQAAGIKLFGENSFGWRISSVLFGTATVGLVFVLGRQLGLSRAASLLAAWLFSLDGLSLTMSRIAMNDIHVTFFFLLSLILYWRWRQKRTVNRAILTALATGAAVATKWSGVFLIGIIFTHLFWETAWRFLNAQSFRLRPRVILLLAFFWLVPAMYLLGYQQMFGQGKDWAHFKELHNQIWWYQTHLEATHPYQSTPLQWIFNARPVYAFTASTSGVLRDIYLQGNTLLFWCGLVAVIWSVSDIWLYGLRFGQVLLNIARQGGQKFVKQLHSLESQQTELHALFFLLLAYFFPWLPWVFSPRIMFFYHYLPAIPFLCLILAQQLEKLRNQELWGLALYTGVITSVVLFYLVFYAHWTALPASRLAFEPVYFFFDSWR